MPLPRAAGWVLTPPSSPTVFWGVEMKARLLRMFLSRAEPALLTLERKQKPVLVGSAIHTERVLSRPHPSSRFYLGGVPLPAAKADHDTMASTTALVDSERRGCGHSCGCGYISLGERDEGLGSGVGTHLVLESKFRTCPASVLGSVPVFSTGGPRVLEKGTCQVGGVVPVVSLQKCRETAP